MDHPESRDLQRYMDDELSSRARRKVETHLESCSECAGEIEELRAVGLLTRSWAEEAAAEAPLEGLADAVLEQVEKNRPLPWGERFRTWIGEFGRYQKKIWVPSLATAGAAAAAALLFVSLPTAPVPVDRPMGTGIGAGMPLGSNVLSVSFGREVDGTLFQVEGKDGSTTAVIWVGEAESVPEVKRT